MRRAGVNSRKRLLPPEARSRGRDPPKIATAVNSLNAPGGTGSFVGATTTFSLAVSPRLVCFNVDVYDVSEVSPPLSPGYFIIDARSLSGESLLGYRGPGIYDQRP